MKIITLEEWKHSNPISFADIGTFWTLAFPTEPLPAVLNTSREVENAFIFGFASELLDSCLAYSYFYDDDLFWEHAIITSFETQEHFAIDQDDILLAMLFGIEEINVSYPKSLPESALDLNKLRDAIHTCSDHATMSTYHITKDLNFIFIYPE